jgi:MFS family permease
MSRASRLPFHYAWMIAGVGMLCVFSALGLGRFALGMLLPSMAGTLPLSYAQIGLVSTGNFVGYLAAVLLCGPAASRFGARAVVVAGLLLMAGSMALVAHATTFGAALALYAVTGLGSGAANVTTMGLVAQWFTSARRGRAAGFVVIGSGLAIMLSGWLVPRVNAAVGPEGWRTSWSILAALVLGVGALAMVILRNRPRELGLEPLGSAPPGPAAATPAASPTSALPKAHPASGPHREAIRLLALIYALFGATYVIYATFIVTALVRERGFTEAAAGRVWSTIGLLSLLSGPVFGGLSDRLGRRAGLALVFSIQLVAYALVAVPLPAAALYVSIACFGVVAWSVPTIVLAAVGDHVGADGALSGFAFVTFAFGLGQIAGPGLAGALAERSGSFASSFAVAAALAGVALLATSRLRSPAG